MKKMLPKILAVVLPFFIASVALADSGILRQTRVGGSTSPLSESRRACIPQAENSHGVISLPCQNIALECIDAPMSAAWTSPKIVSNAKGQLTNGLYNLDEAAMRVHTTGSLAGGKSQFLFRLNEKQVVLDAAAYAEKEGLWLLNNGSKAKVILNQPIGVVGETGELTNVINLYRTKSGFVHGAPGTP